MIALYDKNKVIIRHYHAEGRLAYFSALAGSLPDIRIPIESVEVKYVVTSIIRSFESEWFIPIAIIYVGNVCCYLSEG